MHTTSRLGLDVIDASDAVNAYPTANAQAMAKLDGAILYSEGTISGRPAAAVKGRVYYATDTKLYYFDTGSAWLTVMLAGAWVPLTLNAGANVTQLAGTYTVAARLLGDTVELCGGMQSNQGMDGSVSWATIPAGLRPASIVGLEGHGWFPDDGGTTGGNVGTDGTITSRGAGLGGNSGRWRLDGCMYRLA